jgi:hypothetical protein
MNQSRKPLVHLLFVGIKTPEWCNDSESGISKLLDLMKSEGSAIIALGDKEMTTEDNNAAFLALVWKVEELRSEGHKADRWVVVSNNKNFRFIGDMDNRPTDFIYTHIRPGENTYLYEDDERSQYDKPRALNNVLMAMRQQYKQAEKNKLSDLPPTLLIKKLLVGMVYHLNATPPDRNNERELREIIDVVERRLRQGKLFPKPDPINNQQPQGTTMDKKHIVQLLKLTCQMLKPEEANASTIDGEVVCRDLTWVKENAETTLKDIVPAGTPIVIGEILVALQNSVPPHPLYAAKLTDDLKRVIDEMKEPEAEEGSQPADDQKAPESAMPMADELLKALRNLDVTREALMTLLPKPSSDDSDLKDYLQGWMRDFVGTPPGPGMNYQEFGRLPQSVPMGSGRPYQGGAWVGDAYMFHGDGHPYQQSCGPIGGWPEQAPWYNKYPPVPPAPFMDYARRPHGDSFTGELLKSFKGVVAVHVYGTSSEIALKRFMNIFHQAFPHAMLTVVQHQDRQEISLLDFIQEEEAKARLSTGRKSIFHAILFHAQSDVAAHRYLQEFQHQMVTHHIPCPTVDAHVANAYVLLNATDFGLQLLQFIQNPQSNIGVNGDVSHLSPQGRNNVEAMKRGLNRAGLQRDGIPTDTQQIDVSLYDGVLVVHVADAESEKVVNSNGNALQEAFPNAYIHMLRHWDYGNIGAVEVIHTAEQRGDLRFNGRPVFHVVPLAANYLTLRTLQITAALAQAQKPSVEVSMFGLVKPRHLRRALQVRLAFFMRHQAPASF